MSVLGAPSRGKIFPKKQALPGAGLFAQLPSHNAIPKVLKGVDDKMDVVEDIEKLNKLFVQCSGMNRLSTHCEKVKSAECDEVVLLALLNGSKVTLEDFCAILNNNAVYASLFLSSTLGLLFSPPDAIASLDSDATDKIVYFCGIAASVLLNILNVLIAVISLFGKNKVLRESDALVYLIRAQNNTIISGNCLGFGIAALILAMFPLIRLIYGDIYMYISLIMFVMIIVPFAIYLGWQGIAGHAGYYYMHNGRKALREQKKQGAHEVMPVKDVEGGEEGYASHDPYDPSIALYNFNRIAQIGQYFAQFDRDKSGIVDMQDYANMLVAMKQQLPSNNQLGTATAVQGEDDPYQQTKEEV